jgi:hypothetical protein
MKKLAAASLAAAALGVLLGVQRQSPAGNEGLTPEEALAERRAQSVGITEAKQTQPPAAAQSVKPQAVQDGDWADPQTWLNEQPPADGASVVIPTGRTIIIRTTTDTHLRALQVDGELVFATDTDTSLTVDRLFVSDTGLLQMGTPSHPVADGVEALLTISEYADANVERAEDDGPVLEVHGELSIHGQPKEGMIALAVTPNVGDTVLRLSDVPTTWKVGDMLVIGGSRLEKDQEKVFFIDAVNGDAVSIRAVDGGGGVTADHHVSRDLKPFAVNVTRNAAVASSGKLPGKVEVHNAAQGKVTVGQFGLYGLGKGETGTATTVVKHEYPALAVKSAAPKTTMKVDGMALVNTPTEGVNFGTVKTKVSNGVALDHRGGAWLTPNAAPARLLWQANRQTTVVR